MANKMDRAKLIRRAKNRAVTILPTSVHNDKRRYMTVIPPDHDCIDADQVCQLLGIARSTLYQKVNAGTFAIFPVSNNYFLYSRAEVLGYTPPPAGNPTWVARPAVDDVEVEDVL